MTKRKAHVCVILVVAACVFNEVTASKRLPNEYDDLRSRTYKVVDECSGRYNIDRETINEAILNDSVKYLDPCFLGCLYEKIGLIDNQGKATPEIASSNIEKYISSSDYNTVSNIIRRCSLKVNAGYPKNTCQSASLLTPCLVEYYDKLTSEY